MREQTTPQHLAKLSESAMKRLIGWYGPRFGPLLPMTVLQMLQFLQTFEFDLRRDSLGIGLVLIELFRLDESARVTLEVVDVVDDSEDVIEFRADNLADALWEAIQWVLER